MFEASRAISFESGPLELSKINAFLDNFIYLAECNFHTSRYCVNIRTCLYIIIKPQTDKRMLIIQKKISDVKGSEITPKSVFMNRRHFLKSATIAGLIPGFFSRDTLGTEKKNKIDNFKLRKYFKY